jgi:hypothetical protein
MSIYFLTEFFKYFFRVLHEASSSWLKLFRVFRLHPVCCKIFRVGGWYYFGIVLYFFSWDGILQKKKKKQKVY